MAKPLVDVVICTFNNSGIIGKCLLSLKKLSYRINQFIIVDDFSTDNTVELIKKDFPWVSVTTKAAQSGPSDSRNIGINKSTAEYILFLDSDVEVTKNFLMHLLKSIQQKENVAICGGKLLLPDGTIDSAGGGLTKIGVGFDIGHKKSNNLFNQGRDVLYVPSAAMLVKRKLIKELGSFDETYFYGHEDTDLCWRVNIAGFRVYYEPRAVAYHHKNQTINKMRKEVAYYGTRNRIRSLLKNHQSGTLLTYLPLYFGYSLLDILVHSYRKEKIAAWWWNLRNMQNTLDQRRAVQELRIFMDGELPFSSLMAIVKK